MWSVLPLQGTTTAARARQADPSDNLLQLDEALPSRLEVQLRRADVTEPWGFAIQGGFDQGLPLSIQRVFPGSSAEGQLTRGEIILAIDGVQSTDLTHLQALELITRAGTELTLTIDPRRVSASRTTTTASTPHRSVSQADPRQGPRTAAWAAQFDENTEYFSDDAGATRIAAGRHRSAASSSIRFASTNSMNTLPSGFNEMGWTPKVNKPGSSSAAHKSLSKPWVSKTSTSRQTAALDMGWAPKPRPASAFFVPQPSSPLVEQGWTENTAVPDWTASSNEAPQPQQQQQLQRGGRTVLRQQWQPNGGGVDEPQVPAWYGSLRSAGTRRPWQGGKDGPRGPQKLRGDDDDEGWIPHGGGRAQDIDVGGGHESRWIQAQTAKINAQTVDYQPLVHEYQQHSLPAVIEIGAVDRKDWEPAEGGAKQPHRSAKPESETRRFKSELHDIHLVSTTWTLPTQDHPSQSLHQPRQTVAAVYAGPVPGTQNQRSPYQRPVQAAQASHPAVTSHRSHQQQQQPQPHTLSSSQQQQLHGQHAIEKTASVGAVVFNPPPVAAPASLVWAAPVQAPPRAVEQRIQTATGGQVQPISAVDNKATQQVVVGASVTVRPIVPGIQVEDSGKVLPVAKDGVARTSAFEDFYVGSVSSSATTCHGSSIVSNKTSTATARVEKTPAFNDFYVLPAASSEEVKVQVPVTSNKAVLDKSIEAKAAAVPVKLSEVKVVTVPAFSDFYVRPASNDVKATAPSANVTQETSIAEARVVPQVKAVDVTQDAPPEKVTEAKVAVATASSNGATAVLPNKSFDAKVVTSPAFVDFYVLPASSDGKSGSLSTSPKATVDKPTAAKGEKTSAFEDFYVSAASDDKVNSDAKVKEATKLDVKSNVSKPDVKAAEVKKDEVKAKEATTTEPPKGKILQPPSAVAKKPAPAAVPAPKGGKLAMPAAFGNKSPPGKLKPK